jgi:hypothetical protein
LVVIAGVKVPDVEYYADAEERRRTLLAQLIPWWMSNGWDVDALVKKPYRQLLAINTSMQSRVAAARKRVQQTATDNASSDVSHLVLQFPNPNKKLKRRR